VEGGPVTAGPGRVLVEVSVNIPPGSDLAESLRWLDSLPDIDPDRHECEGFLYMMLAKSAWRRAEQLRQSRADSERRSRARRKRPEVSG